MPQKMNSKNTVKVLIKKIFVSSFSILVFFAFTTPVLAFDPLNSVLTVYNDYSNGVTKVLEKTNSTLTKITKNISNSFSVYYDNYTSGLASVIYSTNIPVINTLTTKSLTTKNKIAIATITKTISTPAPIVKVASPIISEATFISALEKVLNRKDIQDQLRGPQGPAGTNGTSSRFVGQGGFESPHVFFSITNADITKLNVTGNSTLANLTVSGALTAQSITGTVNPNLTLGSILFQGATGIAEDNANLFWDDTNDRLGVGTTEPGASLTVVGQPITSSNSPNGLEVYAADGYTPLVFGGFNGGGIVLNAGDGSSAATMSYYGGNGGDIQLRAGDGGFSPTINRGGAGGSFSIISGNGGGGSGGGNPGTISIQTGVSGGGLLGGDISINTGVGFVGAGNIILNSGGGNVGIGTMVPETNLDINSYVYNGATPMIKFGSTAFVAANAGWGISGGGSNFGASLFSNNVKILTIESNGGAGLGTTYSGNMDFPDNGLIIEGNVGIGTTAPGAILETVKISHSARTTNLRLRNSGSGYNTAASIGFTWSGGTSDGSYISAPYITDSMVEGGALVFATGGSVGSDGTEKVRINPAGNVGIGTTAPTEKLSVNISLAQYGTSDWTQSGLNGFIGNHVNDGNLTTSAFSTDSSGVGSYLHLDTTTAQSFVSVQVTVSNNVTAIWDIEYSDNDSDWTKAYIGLNVNGAVPKTYTASWASVGSHRYWRLYKTNAAAGGNYHNEIQFLTNSSNLFAAQTSNGTGILMPTVGGIQFKQNGTTNWTLGSDSSDSNKFKFSSTDINTGTLMTLDTTGKLGLGTIAPISAFDIKHESTYATDLGKTANMDLHFRDAQGSIAHQIGFGGGFTYANAVFGYVTTSGTNYSVGDMFWATRAVNTDTAPTESMRLTSAGNLGIGTTAPGAALEVLKAGTGTISTLLLRNTDSGVGDGSSIDFLTGAGRNARIYSYATNVNRGDLRFATGADSPDMFTDRMTILNNGNVGIGTTSPNSKLEINGAFTGSRGQLSIVSDTNYAFQTFYNGATYMGGVGVIDGDMNLYNYNGGVGGSLIFISKASSGESMRITSAGNVGIGTTAPNYALDFAIPQGDLQTQRINFAANNGTAETQGSGITWKTNYTGYTKRSAGILQIADGTGYFNSSLAFYTNNAANATTDWSERFRIASNGNVGIGTTAPIGGLEVANGWAYFTKNLGSTALSSSFTQGLAVGWNQSNGQGETDFISAPDGGTTSGFTFKHLISANTTVDLVRIEGTTGNVGIGTTSPGNKLSVNAPTTADSLADVLIATSATTQKGLVIQGKASQTANLFEVQNSTGDIKTFINPLGYFVSRSVLTGTTPTIAGHSSSLDYDVSGLGLTQNSGVVSWGASVGSPTAGLSSTAANTILVGNGTTGSYSGTLIASNVGIGTTTPTSLLHVRAPSTATTVYNNASQAIAPQNSDVLQVVNDLNDTTNIASIYISAKQNSSAIARISAVTGGADLTSLAFQLRSTADATVTTEVMRITSSGFVGIGMTDPSVALDVTGDIEYTGTITDVSDMRLKENIQDFNNGLSIIKGVTVKTFNMIGSTKNETGFIAQNIKEIFPEAVSIVDPANGYMGVSYVSFIPVLTQAVQELNTNLESLTLPITEENNTQTFTERFFAKLALWLGEAGNGIGDLFSNRVKTKELCVGEVCVSESQFLQMVNSANIVSVPTPAPDPTPTPAPAPDPAPTTSPDDPALVPVTDPVVTPVLDPVPQPVADPAPTPTPDPVPVPVSDPASTPTP